MTEQPDPGRSPGATLEIPVAQTAIDCHTECGVHARCALPRSLRAPVEASMFVQRQICPQHDAEATEAVMLMTSEVVAQVVLRADGPVSVAVECDGTNLALSVDCWMDARSSPRARLLSHYISRTIVESTCGASGAERTEQGFTMWCTIPRDGIPAVNSPAR